MAWDKGRYYTRSRKVNGQVVREYIGCGEAGRLAEQQDAKERARREYDRKAWHLEMEEIESFDDSIAKIYELGDIVAKAAMVAAGFHNHRGTWRRRRV